MLPNGMDHPLGSLCQAWLNLMHIAEDDKEERFGRYAKEAMMFFDGDHNAMWSREYSAGRGGYLDAKAPESVKPMFLSSTNKVSEIVQLFLPRLIARDPHAQVSLPDRENINPAALGNVQDPMFVQQYQQMMQQAMQKRAQQEAHADIRMRLLNWLQVEGRKKVEAREAMTEALVKGESPLWTEMYNPPGSKLRYPKSFFDSVDNLLKDPDARKRSDMKWVARKCTHSIWEVAREYGIDPKILRGTGETKRSSAFIGTRHGSASDKKNGTSNDTITYYKIYSKCGLGGRLQTYSNGEEKLKEALEDFGDYCFLVIAPGVNFPLNMPPGTQPEEVKDKVQWPIPFWTDGGWPFESIGFTNKPNDVWFISIVKPAIGELRFINWAMSHLATKVAQAGTILAIKESAGEEFEKQFMERHGPYTVMKIKEITGQLRDNVEVFNLQAFNGELIQVVQMAMEQFDKRTGLIELLYGVSSGPNARSAAESNDRSANATIRVTDMHDRTEDWLSNIFRNEMVAASWNLEGKDIAGPVGELSAHIWDTQMRTQSFDSVVRDFTYRIEAGSAAKPNKQAQQAQLERLGQIIMPAVQQAMQMGNVDPFNAYVTDYGKAYDIDAQPYLLPPPQMMDEQPVGMGQDPDDPQYDEDDDDPQYDEE